MYWHFIVLKHGKICNWQTTDDIVTSLHPSRQQLRLEAALGLQPLCRLSTDRYLTRCELDVPVMGPVLSRTAARGKADALPK